MLQKATPIVIANWKMNGTLLEGMRFFKQLRQNINDSLIGCEIVLCPPFTLLRDMAEKVPNTGIRLGGQDCHQENNGAFTGDISAKMLQDMACDFVILGHSERRVGHGESSETVQKKVASAHKEKLTAILCVGETNYEREKKLHKDMIKQQLEHSIPPSANDENTIIAYEPVWAIGTDKTPSVAEIEEMHNFIFDTVKTMPQFKKGVRVIYGGSVSGDNAKVFLSSEKVNGLLVGRASTDIDDFWKIIQAAG